jgi:hypothetical protein
MDGSLLDALVSKQKVVGWDVWALLLLALRTLCVAAK